MNKLKVAIHDLKDHLGRDTRGLDFLAKVTSVANDQRVRNSTLETTMADMQLAMKRLRDDLDAARNRNEALQLANEQEIAKRQSAELRAQSATAQLAAIQEPPEPPEMLVGHDRVRAVEHLFKCVKKRYKQMPGTDSDDFTVIVDDFVRSFTTYEYTGLGMVVALLAFTGLTPQVNTEQLLDMNEFRQTAEKFVLWFKSRIPQDQTKNSLLLNINPRSQPDRVTVSLEEAAIELGVELERNV